MVDYQSILNELANLNPPNIAFDTERIRAALKLLGNPQDNYPIIHIAGTNGKGSTAAYIEAGLLVAGYKVGKFSSPFLHRLNECIRLNQQVISDGELAELYLAHKPLLQQAAISLTSFEMLTLLMFIYFAKQQINYLVLEVGLGGRDDATNVVHSLINIITNISLEHTQWLGSTLQDIAEHKAGIVHAHGLTIIGRPCPELIAAVAKRNPNYQDCSLIYPRRVKLDHANFTTTVELLTTESQPGESYILGLFGYFQADNFLCAYAALTALGVSATQIRQAARQVCWPGRLQVLAQNPLVIADAAHNPDGAANLVASLRDQLKPAQTILICAVLQDKDQPTMLSYYRQLAEHIIFCALPDQARACDPQQLARLAADIFPQINVSSVPQSALALAYSYQPQTIIITGSTYLLKHFIPESSQAAANIKN